MNRAHCPKVHAGPAFSEYSELNSGALGENLTLVVKNWPKFRETSIPIRLGEVRAARNCGRVIFALGALYILIEALDHIQIAILVLLA